MAEQLSTASETDSTCCQFCQSVKLSAQERYERCRGANGYHTPNVLVARNLVAFGGTHHTH
eukprot:COSAG02_NODE_41444_length_394_cov_1.284746_1_plen_60_part_01